MRPAIRFATLLLGALLCLPAAAESNLLGRVEQQLIRDYFAALENDTKTDHRGTRKDIKPKTKGKKQQGLPPGLAKRQQLPPGLQKQLQRNGRLPPGLEKRTLPPDLEERLPPLPEGRQRVLIDNDLYLIERATGLVLDLMEDLF